MSVVGASCPVPVISLSFHCCSGATLGGWILDGRSRYAVPLLGQRCFLRVVVSDQVAVLGHFVLTWHAHGTQAHCSSLVWQWVLRCPLFIVARCTLLSPALFHLSSTPQAVARGAGGGRCHGAGACGVISCCLGVPVLVSALASLLDRRSRALMLVPHHRRCPPSSNRPTQPASRCLQQWEWVVGQHFLFWGV